MLTGYQLFVKEFTTGKRGLGGTQNMREAADTWNSLSDYDKQDYSTRAKTYKAPKVTKSPTKKSIPGATKRKMFKEEFLKRYPGSSASDAYALWDSLSQADRNAYIGL